MEDVVVIENHEDTTTIKNHKEYCAVDLFKFVCAILVILIHVKPFENVFWIDAGIGLITRIAVPFFFTISSVFLFKKIGQTNLTSKERDILFLKYIFRLFVFYTFWYIVYIFVDAAFDQHFYSFLYYFKNYFFLNNGSILWFLNALLWASSITYVLSKFLKFKFVFIISLLFFAVGYVFSTLRVLFVGNVAFDAINGSVINFIGTQNGLFFAFPYVAMGGIIASKEITYKIKFMILMALAFFAMLAVESLLCVLVIKSDLTFLWISAIPMTFFVVCLSLKIELPSNGLYLTMRKISSLLYVIHILCLKTLVFIWQITNLNGIDSFNILLTVAVIVVSCGISICIYLLSRLKALRFLRWIM